MMKLIHILFTVTDVLKAVSWAKHTIKESKLRGDFKWTKRQRYQSYTNKHQRPDVSYTKQSGEHHAKTKSRRS